jgi:energy-coupling factor transport system permease protein
MKSYKNHSVAIIMYTIVLSTLALLYNNPLYIGCIFCITGFMMIRQRKLAPWGRFLLFSLTMVLFYTLCNPLFSSSGSTILWRSGRLPIVGRIRITLEALLYGLTMGGKLITIGSIFYLYNTWMDTDQALSFFSRFADRSALLFTMTVSLFPRLKREALEVGDIMRARGACIQQVSLLARIKTVYPMWKVLLITALEGSLDMAEAMEARGYGVGQRTRYQTEIIAPSDTALIGCSLVLLVLGIMSLAYGSGNMTFYPVIKGSYIPWDLWWLMGMLGVGIIGAALAYSVPTGKEVLS